MRKIEKTIYNFDELSDEVKNKLIDEENKNQKEFYLNYCLSDDMGMRASDLLNDYFGVESDYLNTCYSLNYSQGDGAMIEFNINIEDLNKKYNILDSEELRFLTDKGIINDIQIRHNNSNYYHEYTFKLVFDYYNDWDFEDIKEEYNIGEDNYNTIESRIYDLLNDFNKHYTDSVFIKDIVKMNRELVSYGYDCINNYDCDIDYITDILSKNEYYENGEIY